MHDLIVFLAGSVFGVCFLILALQADARKAARRARGRHSQRGGYITFDFSIPYTEGRDDPNRTGVDPGGGDVTPPPPYLRLVRDGGSSELVMPLKGENDADVS